MTAKTAGARRRTGNGETERPLNWPGDPETVAPEDIDFEALAHVLANTCRRGGCCRQYHSVAAHAVIVSEEIEALDGLGETRTGGRWRCMRCCRMRRPPGSGARLPDSQRAAERVGRLATGIGGAVREAAGLDAVLDEEHSELLRFVTRMTAAAERRDIMEPGSVGAGPGPRSGRGARLGRRRLPAVEAPHPVDPAGQGRRGLARPFPGARRRAAPYRRRCHR